ncbi:MAG: hypothetical protein A2X25_05590 [Chloroflexi bacterium GWB2_49_20]|nr:MAG: hypothetical protein A2X25_05590 [Chloroflexi bacterium GWB2_49_20]OGN77099.1 MAG: hypothetical protein A2X26_06590 [Chloroflexi bacterium GWC2_49_37]OGN83825.1 MAG: hypothetical protein A2X27_02190 [Chloroflexi bacterium GWD2_49_16]
MSGLFNIVRFREIGCERNFFISDRLAGFRVTSLTMGKGTYLPPGKSLSVLPQGEYAKLEAVLESYS